MELLLHRQAHAAFSQLRKVHALLDRDVAQQAAAELGIALVTAPQRRAKQVVQPLVVPREEFVKLTGHEDSVTAARAAGVDVEADGYSRPYIAAVTYGSAIYGFLAVILSIYAATLVIGDPSPGALPAALVWLGTPLLFYMYIAPGFSHACSAFAVAAFVVVWLHVRREWSIGGVFGNWVQVTDGHRKYARSAVESNFPLSMWSNRWSTMPTHVAGIGLPKPDRRAWLDYMPASDVPVIRQPFQPGDMLPFWVSGPVDRHHLFDLDNDPDEAEELAGTGTVVEKEMTDMLVAALDAVDAPREQYERLGVG
jgi:hypothetical protein